MTKLDDRAEWPELETFIAELRETSVPAADDELLVRIQRSRADGVRVLLPHADVGADDDANAGADAPIAARAGNGRKWMIGIAAAATLVIVPTAYSVWRSVQPGLGGRPTDSTAANVVASGARTVEGAGAKSRAQGDAAAAPPSDSPGNALAQLLAPWPRVAYAQSPGVKREAAYAPVSGVDASRLTAGRRTYVRSSANDYHTMLPHEVLTVETARTTFAGIAAWRIVQSSPPWRPGQPDSARNLGITDTLWLRATDLRPLERRYRMGSIASVTQRFSASELVENDSMLSRPGAPNHTLHRTVPLDSSRVMVHTEATMRALLRSVALRSDWRGSVSVPSTASPAMVLGTPQYLNLRVAGVDTVQTFSGRFVCWRVILDTGAKPDVWYVSQETGETLLTDGANGPSYPESELRLLYGFEETKRVPPVRIR